MRSLVIVLLLSTLATSAFSGADFNVSPVGFSAFAIDGIANPSLSLIRGQTYTFNVNAGGHPFYIKTARVTGAGSQFPTGVTNQGVQVGTLTFAVPLDAPSQLFYQCGNHGSMGGNLNISDPTGVGPNGLPRSAWLGPAVPNPTHGGAQFEFGLPRSTTIDFSVYDARGRLVKGLFNGSLAAGVRSVRWDGRDRDGRPAASGRYFYRLRVEGKLLSGQMVVTR